MFHPYSQLLKQEQAMTDTQKAGSSPAISSGQALVKAIIETSRQDYSSEIEEPEDKTIRAAITSAAPEEYKMLESVRQALELDDSDSVEQSLPKSLPYTSVVAKVSIKYVQGDTQYFLFILFIYFYLWLLFLLSLLEVRRSSCE